MNLRQLLVLQRSQHKKINREIYTCVSILLFAASCNHAGQSWYGIQLYVVHSLSQYPQCAISPDYLTNHKNVDEGKDHGHDPLNYAKEIYALQIHRCHCLL